MTADTAKIVGDAFENVSLTDGVCGWIDLCGTNQQGFDLAKVKSLVELAAIVSSAGYKDLNGIYQATASSQANVLLIGDAILVSQKDPSKFSNARDAVALITLFISQNLFARQFPHRGAIASGALEVGQHHGMRLVAGDAILKATRLERALKGVGVVVAEDLVVEAKTWIVPSSEKPFRFFGAFDSTYLTSEEHFVEWDKFCQAKRMEHPYIAATSAMLKATGRQAARPRGSGKGSVKRKPPIKGN